MSEALQEFPQSEESSQVGGAQKPQTHAASVALGQVIELQSPAELVPTPAVRRRAERIAKGLKARQRSADIDNSMDIYLSELDEPLLTAIEECDLAKTIERGREARVLLESSRMTYEQANPETKAVLDAAKAAKERFIRANLRLVVSIAIRYPRIPGLEAMDLIQEGNLGLEHAVDKYDWRKGFRFSTYATFWIRQHIGHAINEAGLIRQPAKHGIDLRGKLKAVDGDPSMLDPKSYSRYLLQTPSSLNMRLSTDSTAEFGDLLPDHTTTVEQDILDKLDSEQLSLALERLSPRMRYVAMSRVGLLPGSEQFKDIANELGVSPQRVNRMWHDACKVLRSRLDPSH